MVLYILCLKQQTLGNSYSILFYVMYLLLESTFKYLDIWKQMSFIINTENAVYKNAFHLNVKIMPLVLILYK